MKAIMKLFSVLFVQLTVTTLSCAEGDIDGNVVMQLQYNTDLSTHPEFEPRGQLAVKNLRSGAHQFDTIVCDAKHASSLLSLASEGGMYRLKALALGAAKDPISFLTYLPTSSMCEPFREKLTLQLDPFNQVVAVNYAPLNKPCSSKADLSDGLSAKTDLLINYAEQGPQPETASYIQRMEQEKATRETGEVKDNRSFFAKYWMYIIPVVIFIMMSGASGGAEQSR